MTTQSPKPGPIRICQDYVKEFGRPTVNPFNFFMYSFWIIVIVAAIGLLVAGFGDGESFIERFASSYKKIYTATTHGNTWTSIMQDNFLYFVIPAIGILVTLALKTNLRFGNRAIVMFVALGIGFVAGHTFWPTEAGA